MSVSTVDVSTKTFVGTNKILLRRKTHETVLSSLSPKSRVPKPIRMATRATVDDGLIAKVEADGELKKRIAEFYNESSGIWEDIWGDHMHHGFYDSSSTVSLSEHRSAQIRMIEEALQFASVPGQFICSFLVKICNTLKQIH